MIPLCIPELLHSLHVTLDTFSCCWIVSTHEYMWRSVVRRRSLTSHLSHIFTLLSRNQRQGEQRQERGRKRPQKAPLFGMWRAGNSRKQEGVFLFFFSFTLSLLSRDTVVSLFWFEIICSDPVLFPQSLSSHLLIIQPSLGGLEKLFSSIRQESGLIRLNLHGNPFRLSREIIIDQMG